MKKQKLKVKILQAISDFDYEEERLLMGGEKNKIITLAVEALVSLIFEQYCNLIRIKHGREYEEAYRNPDS